MKPYIHKVHYYETDKMGIVHHSNYIRWMEEARIDFLAQLGWDFDKLEETGIVSPVLAVECRYKEVTRFPEEIQIDVKVKEFRGVRLILEYAMHRVGNETIVTTGTTEHAFLDKDYRPLRLKKTHPEFCQALMSMAEKCENTAEEFKICSRRQREKMISSVFSGLMSKETAESIREFHRTFPMYQPTPLAELKETAGCFGVEAIYVKDESYRFGLNAFKVLGGSHAIGKYLAGKLGKELSEISYEMLVSDEVRERLGDITFVTATDGNHGRGVAWTANQFQQKSVVYMPEGSAKERLENIKAAGADASITDLKYDDAVRLASRNAKEYGWILIQDTAWEGYEEIPTWIMQGYGTMGLEALEQMPQKPTHIFLQAGVGSMAAAIAGFFQSVYGEECPMIVIVEPNKADCFYKTAEADDGTLRFTTGAMDTIMAGLACGEPCSIAWEILKDSADYYISCPDYAAAKGMRILGNPMKGDPKVVSGESGASAFGCVAEILSNPELDAMKKQLQLNEKSRILFFSTEGATDRENYKAIVWDGNYPSV